MTSHRKHYPALPPEKSPYERAEMTPAQIAVVVEQIVYAVVYDYGLEGDIVTQASTFGPDLGMDGEDVRLVIMQCEETFKIPIPDDAITEQSRVGELTELISDLLAEKAA